MQNIFLFQINAVCIQFIVKILENLNKYINMFIEKNRKALFL